MCLINLEVLALRNGYVLRIYVCTLSDASDLGICDNLGAFDISQLNSA